MVRSAGQSTSVAVVRLGAGVHGLHRAGARRVLQRRADLRRRDHHAGSEPIRTALIEAAWAYRHKPAIGVTLRRRQHDASPQTLARSWQAQRRLYARYKTMTARGKPAAVAVTAMARELASSGPR